MTDEIIKTLLMQLPAILMAIAALIVALKGKSETKAASAVSQTALNKVTEMEKELGVGEFAGENEEVAELA